jgi:anaerobic selenocysteine-containing dehydrogenase
VTFGTHLPYNLLAGSPISGTKVPEMIVVWGSNPADCTPFSMMHRIRDAKEKGAFVVVIDPVSIA